MIYVVNESQLKHSFLLWTVRVVTVLYFLTFLLFVSAVDLLVSVQFLLISVYFFLVLLYGRHKPMKTDF